MNLILFYLYLYLRNKVKKNKKKIEDRNNYLSCMSNAFKTNLNKKLIDNIMGYRYYIETKKNKKCLF